MPINLPKHFKTYFWDTVFEDIDPVKNKKYIIKRVLDRGNTSSIKWLFANYTLEDVKNTVVTSRDISKKSASFWASYFKIRPHKIACLQKPYSPIHFGLSS